MRPHFALALLAALGSGAPAPAADSAAAGLRIAGDLLGESVEVEVRDLGPVEGEAALSAAWSALVDTERELARIAEQSARQPFPLSATAASWLARGQAFCTWSDGATSVLGAPVRRLWNGGAGGAGLPTPELLEAAATACRCDRFALDATARTGTLATGSAFDFSEFARGWAIDRAVESLRKKGADNALVRVGPVARGVGGGPDGRGWRYSPPRFAALREPLSDLLLLNQAVSVVDPWNDPVVVAGERFPRYFDLRSGKPSTGVAGVLVVTELAADAEPLAAAMAVFGANAGQLRLGSLRPRPSVLWLLGSPEAAAPVLTSSNWSAVKKP